MTTDAATFCARHPDTETALACGRCGTPICPRCMVHTPGGIRCPDCAQLRRPPMYELASGDIAKAVLVAVALAVAFGFIGALFIPRRGFGGFFLLIGLLIGSGAGSLVAESLRRVTNGKRGPVMQGCAVVALAGAAVVRVVLAGVPLDVAVQDISAFVIVGAGIVAAWGRLR